MAKIAVEFDRIVRPKAEDREMRKFESRTLVHGGAWSVSDAVCRAGPQDHPYEEQHSTTCIAMVIEGSFQYESGAGRELMTPGSLLLGNAGQYFECGHEHAAGDRCISFAYEPQYLEALVSETGARCNKPSFAPLRLPPMKEVSPLIARACANLSKWPESRLRGARGISAATAGYLTRNLSETRGEPFASTTDWEEIAIELAMRALEIANDRESMRRSLPAAEARITRIVRMIEGQPGEGHSLATLAREARLSRYHFLRIFRQLTGLTPHRYILRARLRHAATRLLADRDRVLDIALDSGFGDVSNFNHAFRAEFGVSPRSYRKKLAGVTAWRQKAQ